MKKRKVSGDKMALIKRLRRENKALRETCEILSEKPLMCKIEKSLRDIRAGKGIPLSKL
jgi:hypothetical protein